MHTPDKLKKKEQVRNWAKKNGNKTKIKEDQEREKKVYTHKF